MMKICVFLFCLSFISCRKKDDIKILKIAVASGWCRSGECPYSAIEIDSSLHYQYYGGLYANPKGYYYGKFDKKDWAALNKDFGKIDFKDLKETYPYAYDELETEMIIYSSKGKKHIKTQFASLPIELKRIYKQLLKSYKLVKLTKSPKQLHFETTCQIPPKIIGEPKFPPPVIDK
ncbi:MAG: DUF6438 domain-containing protein [Daejeonella sp.]